MEPPVSCLPARTAPVATSTTDARRSEELPDLPTAMRHLGGLLTKSLGADPSGSQDLLRLLSRSPVGPNRSAAREVPS